MNKEICKDLVIKIIVIINFQGFVYKFFCG